MNGPLVHVAADDADARWHAWQMRGAAGERRRIRMLRILSAVVATALSAWLLAQLI